MQLVITAIILTCLVSSQSGWRLPVQLFAWAKMTWEFSKTDSMKTAIVKTFSGKHACNTCKLVRKTASGGKFTDAEVIIETQLAPWLPSNSCDLKNPDYAHICFDCLIQPPQNWAPSPSAPPPRQQA